MKLSDLIPDADVLCALEPDELGLRMLPVLAELEKRNQYRFVPLSLDSFLMVVVGDGRSDRRPPPEYPASHDVEIAVREAWTWLEASVLLIPMPRGQTPVDRCLSRRAYKLAAEPDARKVFNIRRIPKESLHPSIREDVWALYHRSKYDTAVFEAMKAVEVAVRAAAELTPKDIGVPLMRKAFDKSRGPLTDLSIEEGERQARSDLFAGAIGSYKNPHSHRNVTLDDPDEAAEIIMLANHLLRIVDSRKAAKLNTMEAD